MPILENRDQIEKALYALREYQASIKKVQAAQGLAQERLGALKTITGITGNEPGRIEEEVLRMVGQAHVNGVFNHD